MLFKMLFSVFKIGLSIGEILFPGLSIVVKLLSEMELLYSVELLFESILSKHCCCVTPQIAWIAVLHAQHRSKQKHKTCI